MFSFYSFLIVIFTITNTNCYIFSVIMAIYNTEKYLNESIASLLNQSIGYSEIQIILINDGSTDNSEDICLKYQKDYPENVIYLKTNHSGVSEARNIGMSFARGDFINFLDSDDIWDYEAFQYILSFFEQNKDAQNFLNDIYYQAITGSYVGEGTLGKEGFKEKEKVFTKIAAINLYVWQESKKDLNFSYDNAMEYSQVKGAFERLQKSFEEVGVYYYEGGESINNMFNSIKEYSKDDLIEEENISSMQM